MEFKGIVIVGLGPASASSLTREAWDCLVDSKEIWARTRYHPVFSELPEDIIIHSFEGEDEYESSNHASEIAEKLIDLAKERGSVTYAVPGSPFIAEETVRQVMKQVEATHIPVRILDGMSFLEPVCSALGLDPHPKLVLTDSLYLASLEIPFFPASVPALISNLRPGMEASDLKLTLMNAYPDEYPVKLIHNAGLPDELVEEIPLYEIDQSLHTGLMTTLYLPARENGRAFEDFQQIIARLRAPNGCPWDREQTHMSLRPYLLQESYEVLEALDEENADHLVEELGDLLLQIVLHAQIATENQDFNMTDVIAAVSEKIVRRHPHVFGGQDVESVDGVLHNWEQIKAEERKSKGEERKSMLDGIPTALPALTQADQIQQRAQRVGFDWKTIDPVIAKIHEELQELKEADTPERKQSEAGDVLFAVVNLLRWLEIDPEMALRETNTRFRQRFGYIESAAARQGKQVEDLSFEEMDALWEEAKTKNRRL
ncbi:MAG: nucleoside triphosphate pyrophosphohydrolase [Anaerolineaceae bacterium]|nr:nucleoside triphosphate pyrophosphohydrolase [Anaerolineaceae bacterium]